MQDKKEKPAVFKTPPKEESPAPEPELPPEPTEAPRRDEKEEIVFLKLGELFPFKNHPFSVHEDKEMRAMVESVRASVMKTATANVPTKS